MGYQVRFGVLGVNSSSAQVFVYRYFMLYCLVGEWNRCFYPSFFVNRRHHIISFNLIFDSPTDLSAFLVIAFPIRLFSVPLMFHYDLFA